jgi:predicted Zn-dependent peptidase
MKGCRIFLSGNFSDQTMDLIAGSLGSVALSSMKPTPKITDQSMPPPSRQLLSIGDSVQTSIRLGRRLFKRDHPDYEPMFVLNTLLGGYYGSRLMQNLREKKGLTYHIYSSLDTFLFGGYFLISTEVDKTRSELALNEIKKEIKRLQEQPVPFRELETVKNYLRGSFLNYFENAFAYSELVRALSLEGGADTFKKLLRGLEKVDSRAITGLANKYFQEKDLTLVMIS